MLAQSFGQPCHFTFALRPQGPENAWALVGLAKSMAATGADVAALAAVQARFEKAAARADVQINASCGYARLPRRGLPPRVPPWLRCVRSFLQHSPGKQWCFPVKIPRNAAVISVISNRIVL